MGKVIVGITSNERPETPDSSIIHSSVSRHFARAVIKAGGIPIHIPVCHPDMAKPYADMIDRLILTGGQDVQPSYYHQENDADSNLYFPERDAFEFALVEETMRQKKPIMGICRGLQLYNTILGGDLNLDIKGHQHDNPDVLVHDVRIDKGNGVYDIFGATEAVNSLHHQSIKTLASGLEVLARDSHDGTIEAIQAKDKSSFIGLQWHPEYLLDRAPKNQQLFDYFLSLS